MKCPYCGRDVSYSDRFCKCGAELDMVVCQNCGTPNITLATFCGNCGHMLTGAKPYVPEPEEAEAEEPAETAIPEQETEEDLVSGQETEAEVEQKPEEPAVPEGPEEAAVPEETPEEPGVPEEKNEEVYTPEQEPEETEKEAVVSEEKQEFGQETEGPAASEERPGEVPEPEKEPEEVAEPGPEERPEETVVPEEGSEEPVAGKEEPEEEIAPQRESEDAFAAAEEPEEPVVSEPEEEIVSEPESEAAAAAEESGGKRRRGGLIALWIVIAIIVVIVIVFILLSTRGNREETTSSENTENLTGAVDETENDLTADKDSEEESAATASVSDVSFERKTTEDDQEYAIVTAKGEDGNAVWEYTTPQYEKADLDRTSEIGLHGASYFLVQDGTVVSLDKATGEVLWENKDYGGTPVDHSWAYAADGLYLCGYEGPAIYGVSYEGETLGKIEAFDDLAEVTETNLWPYKVLVSGTEATVYYGPENVLEDGDEAISENEATVYSVNLQNWEYQLVSNGAAKVDTTSADQGNGSSNGGSDTGNGTTSGSSDAGGSSGNGGSSSGSASGTGSNSGSGGSGSASGSNGGSGGGASGSNGSSGSSGGSGSGGSGSSGGSAAPTVNMSDVKEVTASSYLYESNVKISHDPKYLVDGTLKNAWCEDASGDGIGQWASVSFNGTYTVSGMKINAGYQKSESLYYENCRPKEITITFSDGSSFNTTLEDVNKEQTVSFPNAVSTSSVTITIRSVYKGSKYEDTVISEVSFY